MMRRLMRRVHGVGAAPVPEAERTQRFVMRREGDRPPGRSSRRGHRSGHSDSTTGSDSSPAASFEELRSLMDEASARRTSGDRHGAIEIWTRALPQLAAVDQAEVFKAIGDTHAEM